MKEVVLSHWNFMRIFRLLIGLAILIQAISSRDWLFAFAGILFCGMAIFNVACCGMGGCPTNLHPDASKTIQDISYEEVVK